MESAEEQYLNKKVKFLNALHALESTSTTRERERGCSPIDNKPRRALPPIAIPSFSGKYSEWNSFKDFFITLVASDPSLTDVERLHYLKSNLTGDAANLIKNIPVTGNNYSRAWAKLTAYFDNKRALIYSCLDALFQLDSMRSESYQALKQLKDGTSEAIETLQVLGRPVDEMDDFLVHITVRRFDSRTRRDWELSLGDSTNPVTWKALDAFMKTRIQALEMSTLSKPIQPMDSSRSSKGVSRTQSVAVHNVSKAKPRTCSHCQADHYISSCDKFRALSIDNRNAFVLEKKLCLNCLGLHQRKDCRSTGTCVTCRGRHHSLLHRTSDALPPAGIRPQLPSSQRSSTQAESATPSEQAQPRNAVNAFTTKATPPRPGSILLATAKLIASSTHGRTCVVRALIDPCSEVSFVAEVLAQRLRLPRRSVFVPITGAGAAPSGTAKGQVNVTISPLFEGCDKWKITALVLPRLTDYLPSSQPITSANLINGLCLADPEPNSADPIEIILGADVYPSIIREGLRKSADGRIIAQATELGWILTGSHSFEVPNSHPTRPMTSLQCLVDMELSSQLERFWIQEEVLSQTSLPLTADEVECETHFASTHRRDTEGRYVLRLPFNSKLSCLGNSETAAQRALLHSEKRFKREPEFRENYTKFMDNYASLGHMESTTSSNDSPSFLLPHHGVFKVNGDTTKLRVVFNGSVKLRDGLAINDCLHVGPKLQADLFDILLRWRKHRYVFSADIEKMFRQILIDPADRPFQRILWRDSEDKPIQLYNLCTVTYGLASSPFQAIRTLQQLAKQEERFPRAAQLIRQDCYVDDIFLGADTVKDAHQLKTELNELLLAGGFPLSKWTANHPSLLTDLPQDHHATYSTWQKMDTFQMLGVSWQPLLDAFSFQFNRFVDSDKRTTKRTALSLIAQLYDPI